MTMKLYRVILGYTVIFTLLGISFPMYAQLVKVEESYRLWIYYKKFKLDGHSYIYFHTTHNLNVIHDPDCPCRREDERTR